MGFKRWDILHLVMDIFQGWFKNGTDNDNFVDFRSFSALYMLLRILFCFSIGVTIVLNIFSLHHWTVLGLFHVILGALFLMIKPYKKDRMNRSDGLILLLLGSLIMSIQFDPKFTFIAVIVTAALAIASVGLYFVTKCIKTCCV